MARTVKSGPDDAAPDAAKAGAGDSHPSAVQSGDLQDLPDVPGADSESVRELLEEGQAFEAAVVNGIENAPPADEGEVRTREVPADDVPPEYLEH